MADQIVLKTKDICGALGVSRHHFRTWVENLPPYSQRQKRERSACRYGPADLLFFAITKSLVEKYGLSTSFLSKISESLYSCIREPQSLTSQSFIFITDRGASWVRGTEDSVLKEGILVDLTPAQSIVYQYLGISLQQTKLALGLVQVI